MKLLVRGIAVMRVARRFSTKTRLPVQLSLDARQCLLYRHAMEGPPTVAFRHWVGRVANFKPPMAIAVTARQVDMFPFHRYQSYFAETAGHSILVGKVCRLLTTSQQTLLLLFYHTSARPG